MATPVSNGLDLKTARIVNVGDPVNPQDASTKNYVDTNIQLAALGISVKPPVAAVSTSNIATLSGLTTTVDGVALNTAGMRVLLTAQSTPSANGPWVVQSSTWTRPSGDGSPNAELEPTSLWIVAQGTTYADTQWLLTTPASGTITPGTTSLTIVKFNASTPPTSGNAAIAVSGTAVSLVVAPGGGITVGAQGAALDATATRYQTVVITGDGSTTAFGIAHSLGKTLVGITMYDSAGQLWIPDWKATGNNAGTLTFLTAPSNGTQFTLVFEG